MDDEEKDAVNTIRLTVASMNSSSLWDRILANHTEAKKQGAQLCAPRDNSSGRRPVPAVYRMITMRRTAA